MTKETDSNCLEYSTNNNKDKYCLFCGNKLPNSKSIEKFQNCPFCNNTLIIIPFGYDEIR